MESVQIINVSIILFLEKSSIWVWIWDVFSWIHVNVRKYYLDCNLFEICYFGNIEWNWIKFEIYVVWIGRSGFISEKVAWIISKKLLKSQIRVLKKVQIFKNIKEEFIHFQLWVPRSVSQIGLPFAASLQPYYQRVHSTGKRYEERCWFFSSVN